jgi:hypothetical protein
VPVTPLMRPRRWRPGWAVVMEATLRPLTVRERTRSMPIAADVNDPEYWQQRAKEARLLAEQMPDETAKQTMLSVAEECDKFAIKAAMCSIYELAVSRVTDC